MYLVFGVSAIGSEQLGVFPFLSLETGSFPY